jgi:hypothetical protein
MRRIFSTIVLAATAFTSAAYAAAAPPTTVEVIDQFSVIGIKVDATGLSPRAARDLAMTQGRPLAWSKLFRRFTDQPNWGAEPQLAEHELLGLILSSDAGNERRNTTRYTADITFHFNPAAVRHLLYKSNIAFTDATISAAGEWEQVVGLAGAANEDATTHLAVNVQFRSAEEWVTLRAQLAATKAVTGVDIVSRAAHDAQLYLTYSGEIPQIQAALAQHALELTSSDGEYTLALSDIAQTARANVQ